MTNTQIQRIALGTAQFGMPYGIANKTGQPSLEEVAQIIELAKRSGINTIDTAISYGDSEKILGQIGVKDFQVITKLPEIPYQANIQSWVHQQVESSLQRLSIEKLYGVMLHKPQQLNTEIGTKIIEALLSLKEEGLVKKIGISIYSPVELEEILPQIIPDIVQFPFNLIDRRFISWFDTLIAHKVEIHSRSAFLQGLLLMPPSEVASKFSRWQYLWDKWYAWQESAALLPIAVCLKFVLSFPHIRKIVIGIDHCKHLTDILSALSETPEIPVFPEISSDDVELVNPSLWHKS